MMLVSPSVTTTFDIVPGFFRERESNSRLLRSCPTLSPGHWDRTGCIVFMIRSYCKATNTVAVWAMRLAGHGRQRRGKPGYALQGMVARCNLWPLQSGFLTNLQPNGGSRGSKREDNSYILLPWLWPPARSHLRPKRFTYLCSPLLPPERKS